MIHLSYFGSWNTGFVDRSNTNADSFTDYPEQGDKRSFILAEISRVRENKEGSEDSAVYEEKRAHDI